MKPRSMCALVLALAFPALAQTQPPLEPLVPGNTAPKKRARKKPAPPAGAKTKPGPAQTQGALPPLVPLAPPQPTRTVGVLVLAAALPEAVASRVADGLRAVVRLDPYVKDAVALQAPQPCTNEACWVIAGSAANVDQVVVATLAASALRVRVIEVASRKRIAQALQERVSGDPAQITAWAQALTCKLLVPAGCTGEVMVEVSPTAELLLDGQPLRSREKRMVPVGVHTLRIKEGNAVSSKRLAVVYEKRPPPVAEPSPPPAVVATPVPSPAPNSGPVVAPAAAVTDLPAPRTRRTWTRTAGYATAGVAVAAAAAGIWFGVKSRSDLDRAESGYRANGGAYQPADLNALQSGNSKAHTANALFIASGVLLAASAALTFAF